MIQLNPRSVETVYNYLKGNKQKKFIDSVTILNQSLAQGSWTPRGSVKANSGFYQGLIFFNRDKESRNFDDRIYWEDCALDMALKFGQLNRDVSSNAIERLPEGIRKKVPAEVIYSWLNLCREKSQAYEYLAVARPKPVVTAIGLSPKVTKTLKDMDLDIDLRSIRMADLEKLYRPKLNRKTGEAELDEDGEPVMEPYYVVKWTKGIVHSTSRFAYSGGCEACGKRIPSGQFVPVEARDLKGDRFVSLWIGCDCARNIFGIKDIGVEKT